MKRRTLKRTKDTIVKYRLLGLFILVAIPIPTTGAWTGCIAASLLKIDYKNALFVILAGVLVSGGIIVFALSYHIVSGTVGTVLLVPECSRKFLLTAASKYVTIIVI